MRILDIIASLDPLDGGPQHTVRAMTPYWRALGHEVAILTLDAVDAAYLLPELHAIPLGKPLSQSRPMFWSKWLKRVGYTPGAVHRAAEVIKSYDVVIVHGLWNYSTLMARCALAGSNVPYFVFCHGMLDPWHKRAYPWKDRLKKILWPFNEGRLLRRAQAVFFTTQPELDLARGTYRPYRLNPIMIGYGCDGPDDTRANAQIAAFFESFPQLRRRKFLIFLSRIHAKKGCDILLEAFAHCRQSLGDVDLVFAGPDQTGWQSQLEQLADRLDVGQYVHWTGMISGDVKWGAFRSAEAFVLPSHGENFGIVVAESMACGTPVIISDKVNLYHNVLDHGAGLVASDDLAGTIASLDRFAAMSPDERATMSRNARECYITHFGLDAAAHRVLDALTRSVSPKLDRGK